MPVLHSHVELGLPGVDSGVARAPVPSSGQPGLEENGVEAGGHLDRDAAVENGAVGLGEGTGACFLSPPAEKNTKIKNVILE